MFYTPPSPLRSQADNSVGTDTGFNIDYKRVLYHIYKYWYLVLAFLLFCLALSFIHNRYATKVYPVTASIIIKESEEGSEGKLLYNNPLVNFYKNYLNELYIVRSHPLIRETILDLNLQVGFYEEGNVLTSENYRTLPVSIRVVDEGDSSRAFSIQFMARSESEFAIGQLEEEDADKFTTFKFDDTVDIHGIDFVFHKMKPFTSKFINEPFIFSYTPSMMLASSYISRLNAEWAEEGAGVINLSLNGSIPQKEIDFLNGLIHEYEEYNLEKKGVAATRTIEFISNQIDGIKDSLSRAEQQLELFKDKNVVTDLNGEAMRLYKRVEELEMQRIELSLRSNYYKYLLDYLTESKNLDQIILPTSIGIEDNILSGLISKMIDLQLEMKMILSNDKLENPIMAERRNRIQDIRRDIVESVNNQKGVDKIKLEFITKSIKDVERQLDFLPAAERQLVSIKRNYGLLENLYVFLLQKKAEAGISKASTTSDVAIVNPPLAGKFISPRIQLNYLIALCIGLAIPLLFFVSMELMNTRIQSREDIEEQTVVPVLGGTGHKKSVDNLEVMTHPKSAVSESFRALRSNLFYFLQNKDRGLFLVTSSISGEGKTFTSINLASVFALSGKKTLIIGADMRRPKIFEDFQLSNHEGLSSFLADMSDFDSVVQKTKYDNLFMVSGGGIPPNPSELIMSDRMKHFIALAREKFDIVVIDSPPLGLVADAFELAKFADHTIFLVRQDYTPKVLLRTIQDFHQSGKLSNVSIVLNDIYRSGLGYGYGYGYGYSYSYGGKDGADYYS